MRGVWVPVVLCLLIAVPIQQSLSKAKHGAGRHRQCAVLDVESGNSASDVRSRITPQPHSIADVSLSSTQHPSILSNSPTGIGDILLSRLPASEYLQALLNLQAVSSTL